MISTRTDVLSVQLEERIIAVYSSIGATKIMRESKHQRPKTVTEAIQNEQIYRIASAKRGTSYTLAQLRE